RSAAPVPAQPLPQAAAARPRRGTSLRRELQPQAARSTHDHLRAAGHPRGGPEPPPRVARALRLARRGEDCDAGGDRKSTRLNSSHVATSYAVLSTQKKRTRSKSQISSCRVLSGPHQGRRDPAPRTAKQTG